MHDRRLCTRRPHPFAMGRPPFRGALSRRTLLSGLAALAAAGLAMPVRADDMSAEMILNDPEAPVGGNPNGDLTISGDIDLSRYRYDSLNPNSAKTAVYGSGEPGRLVIRAGGNLNVFGNVSEIGRAHV